MGTPNGSRLQVCPQIAGPGHGIDVDVDVDVDVAPVWVTAELELARATPPWPPGADKLTTPSKAASEQSVQANKIRVLKKPDLGALFFIRLYSVGEVKL
jgi:hypothetical protein